MGVDLKALIEKQRAELEVVKSDDVEVVLGGEIVTLTVEKLHPDEWDALILRNPPRPGAASDEETGYNTKGVTLGYPRLRQDGDLLGAERIKEMYSVLDSTWRNALSIVIWGVNINNSLAELRALGKARAGRKSPSPAN